VSQAPDELQLRVVTDKTELCRIMLASWGSHSMMIDLHVYDVAEIDALGLFEPSGKTAALASWTCPRPRPPRPMPRTRSPSRSATPSIAA